jgi:UDP-N-acetyl-D-mannosaminuronate dehydrogenase
MTSSGYDLESVSPDPATLADVDAVAILTDHTTFDYDAIVAAAPLVVDTRNAVKRPHPHVFRPGAPQPPRAESGLEVAATANFAA